MMSTESEWWRGDSALEGKTTTGALVIYPDNFEMGSSVEKLIEIFSVFLLLSICFCQMFFVVSCSLMSLRPRCARGWWSPAKHRDNFLVWCFISDGYAMRMGTLFVDFLIMLLVRLRFLLRTHIWHFPPPAKLH